MGWKFTKIIPHWQIIFDPLPNSCKISGKKANENKSNEKFKIHLVGFGILDDGVTTPEVHLKSWALDKEKQTFNIIIWLVGRKLPQKGGTKWIMTNCIKRKKSPRH